MPLTKAEMDQIDDRVELDVRRYFDHYLEVVFPQQMQAHNADMEAHGGITRRFGRLKALLIGLVFGAGLGVGSGLTELITHLLGR